VVSYFSDEVKAELCPQFRDALVPDGSLFLGAAETMLNAEDMGFTRTHGNFYLRLPTPDAAPRPSGRCRGAVHLSDVARYPASMAQEFTPTTVARSLVDQPRAVLLLMVLAAISVTACGGDADSPAPAENDPRVQAAFGGVAAADPDNLDPVPLLPATSIPAGLNGVELPVDTDPIAFNFTVIELTAEGQPALTIDMLVADTFARRGRGLMFRTTLPPSTGMIFAFPARSTSPFWMKDTPLDLDIAFLTEDGEIQEILTLDALSVELVHPELPYHFAVELPRGWFERHEFHASGRFLIPPSVQGFAE